jgi:uroporphyrinogen decarboxylase
VIDYAGRNPRTINTLKTMNFDHPEWIEAGVGIMMATWMKYKDELMDIVLRHPKCFPGAKAGMYGDYSFPNPGPLYSEGFHTDNWGTVWQNIERGLDSIAVEHPLADWSNFDSWTPPDPMTQMDFGSPDWDAAAKGIEDVKKSGGIARGGGLYHGFFYMRLYYLREFENLMMDFATDEPKIHELIAKVEEFCVAVTQKYIELGAEWMIFGEDLGNQHALPISPAMWRKYIKPSYEAIMGPCRDAGIPVYLHSDGHILPIIQDLKDVGVTVINPQIRANGLDGLAEWKGRIVIHLDLDRQLFPFASPQENTDHVHESIERMKMPEGGLMINAECEPDVSLENIDAICTAVEEACNLPDPADVDV